MGGKSFFNQPLPYFRKKWLVVFITTLWVFLVFLFITPIALNVLKNVQYKWIIVCFTVGAFISSGTVTYLFPLLFKTYHDPEKWTIGKFLLFSLSITTIMWVFSIGINDYIVETEGLTSLFHPLLKVIIIYIPCLFVSIIPTLSVFLIESFLDKKYSSKEQVDLPALGIDQDVEVVRFLESTKNEFELDINHFLYAEVIKNNVTLFYLEKDEVCQKTIRATLTLLLEVLADYPYIVRTHRAFVVNTRCVIGINGNSHGYQLTLNNLKSTVPVSKTYTAKIKQHFSL